MYSVYTICIHLRMHIYISIQCIYIYIYILYMRMASSFRIPVGAPSKTCNLEALCAFLWVIRDLRRGMRVQ